MRHVRPLILLVLLLPCAVWADRNARVDEVFASWASKEKPGCTVGVDQDGQPPIRRAYGMADLEHDIANTPDTIIEAGSVSKQFTAAAVLLLVQQGKLSLSDDVRKHVPELPDHGKTITIDHLIHHTSGLRDWGVLAEIAGWPRGTRIHTHAHVLDIASRQKALNHDPGAEFSYTNTGYNLLAVIVQRVSGQSLAEFSRQQIFEPLGMTHTQWRDDFTRIVKGRAIAYASGEDGAFHSEMPFENVYGNGGLLTTVGDLLIWNRNFAEHKVGGPELIQAMERRYRLTGGREIEYASGLYFTSYQGVREVSHSGATAGYRAFLARYPDQHLSVVVLCNAGDADAVGLAHQTADLFLAGHTRAAAPINAIQLPEEELSSRAGFYRSLRAGEPMKLSVKDGRLVSTRGLSLAPISPTELRSETGVRVLFEPGGLRYIARDGEEILFERVAEASPTPAQLAEYAGEYVSDEAEVTYTVKVEDGKLFLKARPDISLELAPLYADGFLNPVGIIARFLRDGSGKVTEVSFALPRVRDLRLRRR